jgi:hypothetical protein
VGNRHKAVPVFTGVAASRRSPALPLRPSHGYAAGLHHGLPGHGLHQPGEFPAAARGCQNAPLPAQIRQIRAGLALRGVTTPVPRVLLSIPLRTRTIWQYWHIPALLGLLPPSPAPPGSGCPSSYRAAATTRRRRSPTSTQTTAPQGARNQPSTPSPSPSPTDSPQPKPTDQIRRNHR